METVTFTHIGGPTLLLEIDGIRILTDPTFDAPREYQLPGRTLVKLSPPLLAPADVLPIDMVLLTHDHHFDNLDDAGRALLKDVPTVITTESGARRLGDGVNGLCAGQTITLSLHSHTVRVTATPARHGPPGSEPLVGDVIGFLLQIDDSAPIYISGDTVLYDELNVVLKYGKPSIGVLHMGRASTRGMVLTMDAAEAAQLAERLGITDVVPVHYEGWAHFTESEETARAAFDSATFSGRVHWLASGVPQSLPVSKNAEAV